LLTLCSNLARFAGWLSFDLGNYDVASTFYEQARIAAHEAENVNLSIFVLCNMSHLATWQGHPRVGIDHAMAAQAWANSSDDPLLRAYTHDVAARAYASAGMAKLSMDALDHAERGIHHATPQTPATSLVYFYGPGQFAQTRSQCLLEQGEAAKAMQAAADSLVQVSSSFVRNQAFSTFHLGNALVATGELAEGARVIGDAAALAARNRSPRLVQTLTKTHSSLQTWHSSIAVRELNDQLAVYGLLPSSSTT
jgi:ATP/maltotriose-dependent transcriptional regulator MalT